MPCRSESKGSPDLENKSIEFAKETIGSDHPVSFRLDCFSATSSLSSTKASKSNVPPMTPDPLDNGNGSRTTSRINTPPPSTSRATGHHSQSSDSVLSHQISSGPPIVGGNPSPHGAAATTGSQAAAASSLRRRSAQNDPTSTLPAATGNVISGSIASRRPSAHSAMQSDFSLSSLPENSISDGRGPALMRGNTPTPVAASPFSSPFGKQRASDEVRAVDATISSRDIQRPASAPPRGSRTQIASLGEEGAEYSALEGDASSHLSNPSKITDQGYQQGYLSHLSNRSDALTTRASLGRGGTSIDKVPHAVGFPSTLSNRSLILLFVFITLWGAVLSLDRLTTYSYQTIALNSFSAHSSLALINVIRAVIAAISAIPFATIADICGRYRAFAIGMVLYTAGHILLAASFSTASYVGGIVLFEIGANGLFCVQTVVLADMTSSRNRLFFQMVPQLPFLIFSFVSSDIYQGVLPQWRWGVGMFAILGPVSLLPITCLLRQSQHNHQKNSKPSIKASFNARPTLGQTLAQIQKIFDISDFIGLFLLSASLTLLLVPLTLAASAPDSWESPRILAMLAVGAALVPVFTFWETRYAKRPIMSLYLRHNRTFWGGAATVTLLWSGNALMVAYFPTYLYVVHDVSNRTQQNISVIYSFTVAAASLPVALTVRWTRRYMPFAVVGVLVYTAGLGLMINFRGEMDSLFKVVSSQIVIGLGGALTVALVQAAVQVSVPPPYVAQSIATLNVFSSMGNAIGSAVAGAMWSNILPGFLVKQLAPLGAQNQLSTIYTEPLTWIESHAVGTSERSAVSAAYNACWRTMVITATAICAASLVSTTMMPNNKLNDTLSAVGVGLDETSNGSMNGKKRSDGGAAGSHHGDLHEDRDKLGKEKLFGDELFERVEHAFGKRCLRCAGERAGAAMTKDGASNDTRRYKVKDAPKSSHNKGDHDDEPICSASAQINNGMPSEIDRYREEQTHHKDKRKRRSAEASKGRREGPASLELPRFALTPAPASESADGNPSTMMRAGQTPDLVVPFSKEHGPTSITTGLGRGGTGVPRPSPFGRRTESNSNIS